MNQLVTIIMIIQVTALETIFFQDLPTKLSLQMMESTHHNLQFLQPFLILLK